MRKTVVLIAAVAALGLWAGVSAYQSAWPAMTIHSVLAILYGGVFLVYLWLWYRAKPGSGDAMILPSVILMLGVMLIGLLPRVFWPSAGSVQIVCTILSTAAMTVIFVTHLRRRRTLSRGAPSI